MNEFVRRVQVGLWFKHFSSTDMIAGFLENENGIEAARRMVASRDEERCTRIGLNVARGPKFAEIERDFVRGLLTKGEYGQEQIWAEVESCARIAIERWEARNA